ncbi:carbohydrate kinase [Nonomuraea sp. NPDC050536]|uniref:carbohydrate kinase n=1 Tax=Nonomuraea sp. NPDC050536 TaxID=3364366 RepID=UPI0037CB4140
MIVACGEALVDLVPLPDEAAYTPRPGGSPMNVAVGLGRLGIDVAMLARIADDGFGRLLRAHLTTSSVDLSLAIPAAEPTTLAVVTLDAGGAAQYAFYVEGSADGGWRPEQLPALPPATRCLHVAGSLALAVPSMGATLEQLLEGERPRRTLAFDPNLRPRLARDPDRLRSRFDHWLTLVDLVKLSSEDVAWLAPGEPVATVAARLRARGPRLVVVTRGADGVHALGPDGPVDLPAEKVQVVDTVGAGDAFMSGLLATLDRAGRLTRDRLGAIPTGELTTALAYALHIAAITCTHVGADPPWQQELAGQTATPPEKSKALP